VVGGEGADCGHLRADVDRFQAGHAGFELGDALADAAADHVEGLCARLG